MEGANVVRRRPQPTKTYCHASRYWNRPGRGRVRSHGEEKEGRKHFASVKEGPSPITTPACGDGRKHIEKQSESNRRSHATQQAGTGVQFRPNQSRLSARSTSGIRGNRTAEKGTSCGATAQDISTLRWTSASTRCERESGVHGQRSFDPILARTKCRGFHSLTVQSYNRKREAIPSMRALCTGLE
jgi:hypothetical protein